MTEHGSGSQQPDKPARVTLRPMTDRDIPPGMDLSRIAGWNQLEADWRRAWELDSGGCFVATIDGLVVGTVASCSLASEVWIGLLLVNPSHRRVGIATKLLQHVIDHWQSRGDVYFRLDATDLGRSLYERFGFRAEYDVYRLSGVGDEDSHARVSEPIHPLEPSHFQAVLDLDRAANGIDRSKLLIPLMQQSAGMGTAVLKSGKLQGFLLKRAGRLATFLGPLVACDRATGRSLLNDVLACRIGEPVLIDVPAKNRRAVEAVSEAGLSVVRSFTRMGRGQCPRGGSPLIWAGSGPEKG